jgi:dTDP-4-dehydrorhamnose reductase
VTGAGGQVGRALSTLRVPGRYLTRSQFDVTNHKLIPEMLEAADVVVHLAAMTQVDLCEEQPERCHDVNVRGTQALASAAEEKGARFVFLSSDYVFDGKKQAEYLESDEPNPLNVYGRSKLEAEKLVANSQDALVIRTSWVFGDGRNFVRSILSAARRGQELRVVADQKGRPTYALDLARGIIEALNLGLKGLVHLAGSGAPCTWAQLAEEALISAGINVPVEPVDSQTYARTAGRLVAPRPANSTLALEKAERLGLPLGDWRSGLRKYVKEFG